MYSYSFISSDERRNEFKMFGSLHRKLDDILQQNSELLHYIHHLDRLQHEIGTKIMADAASILAKITANTAVLTSTALAVTALQEGAASIADEIIKLKAQIAAIPPGGVTTPIDFGPLDTAADDQAKVIAGLASAIPASTPTPAPLPVPPFNPSNN